MKVELTGENIIRIIKEAETEMAGACVKSEPRRCDKFNIEI